MAPRAREWVERRQQIAGATQPSSASVCGYIADVNLSYPNSGKKLKDTLSLSMAPSK